MKIVFSKGARNDLLDIIKFISKDKPKAAQKWAAEIIKSVVKLADYPRLGGMVPEFLDDSIREIIKGQNRIVYKINFEMDTVAILAVHHSQKLLV